jgi:hypothetical protein
MRVLSFLLMTLCLATVSASLTVTGPLFKFPYGGNHVLLDVDVQNGEGNFEVKVQVPASASGEANAIFKGPAFGFRAIHGHTTHHLVSGPARALVSWNGVDTLTFRDIDGSALGESSQGNGWVNFNFQIPDAAFNSPSASGFIDEVTSLPLDLVYDDDYQGSKPKYINLAYLSHFIASSNTQENQ